MFDDLLTRSCGHFPIPLPTVELSSHAVRGRDERTWMRDRGWYKYAFNKILKLLDKVFTEFRKPNDKCAPRNLFRGLDVSSSPVKFMPGDYSASANSA